jgi:RNA polymerase sigma factor (sigma-70 family)
MLLEAGSLAAASDRELLGEFARRRDEAAFEAIVARYGRLVLNVGRKILHDPRDVEDAFQATFLVLVRRPPRLRVGESLGPWISTVAYRVAARVRANRIRLNRLETAEGLEDAPAAPAVDAEAKSDAIALHEEVSRLPDRLRRPVVFCYLEGLTHERAAERLGCPVGTVRSRLARARSLLHRRLVARGVAPAVAPLEALLSLSRPVEPSLRLVERTIRLAAGSSAGWAEAGVASASLLSLVNGVVRMMKLKQAAVACSLLFPVGLLAAGAQAYQQASDGPDKIVVGGKTYVAEPEGPKTYPMTYYVGDLIGISPVGDKRPAIDLAPIIRLITRHVAPGTWTGRDSAGKDVSESYGIDQVQSGSADRRIGSITPFFLSISLIVRHTAETHKEVASLLEDVRNVVFRTSPQAVQAVHQTIETMPDGRVFLEPREDPEWHKTQVKVVEKTKATKPDEQKQKAYVFREVAEELRPEQTPAPVDPQRLEPLPLEPLPRARSEDDVAKQQVSGKPFSARTTADLAIEQLTRKSPTPSKAKAIESRTEVVEVGPHGKVVVHRGPIDEADSGARVDGPSFRTGTHWNSVTGLPAPGSPPGYRVKSQSAQKERLRWLLRQLQSELDTLDAADAPTPSQRKDLNGDFEPTVRPLDRGAVDRPRQPS